MAQQIYKIYIMPKWNFPTLFIFFLSFFNVFFSIFKYYTLQQYIMWTIISKVVLLLIEFYLLFYGCWRIDKGYRLIDCKMLVTRRNFNIPRYFYYEMWKGTFLFSQNTKKCVMLSYRKAISFPSFRSTQTNHNIVWYQII